MKRFFAVALAAIMVLSLAACGSKEEEPAAEGDAITLQFQQWWGVELPDGALAEICQGFTDETGIAIELLSNPYADTKTQIAAGAAAGTMADVVGLDGSWVYDFAKQGSIANLTELMTGAGYDDSQLSAQIQFEGNTYMIPVVNFAYPMYANMDILEAAGVKEIPTTRDEFLAACAAVKAYDSSIAGFAIPLSSESPSGIQNQVMTWLWAEGASMLAEGKPAVEGNAELDAILLDRVTNGIGVLQIEGKHLLGEDVLFVICRRDEDLTVVGCHGRNKHAVHVIAGQYCFEIGKIRNAVFFAPFLRHLLILIPNAGYLAIGLLQKFLYVTLVRRVGMHVPTAQKRNSEHGIDLLSQNRRACRFLRRTGSHKECW